MSSKRNSAVLTLLARLAGRVPGQGVLVDRAMAGRLDTVFPAAVAVALQTGGEVGTLLAARLRREGTAELAQQALEDIPVEADCLREVRRWAVQTYIASFKEDSEDGRHRRTPWLVSLATEYGDPDFRDAALTGIHDGLVEARSGDSAEFEKLADDDLVNVAKLLSLRGMVHEHADRAIDALEARQQALEAHRILHERGSPAVDFEDIVLALDNVADLLDEVGQGDEARGLRIEATVYLKEFLETADDLDMAARSARVRLLGYLYNDLGNYEQSARVWREAIALERELVRVRPGQHEADLADAEKELELVISRAEEGCIHEEGAKGTSNTR